MYIDEDALMRGLGEVATVTIEGHEFRVTGTAERGFHTDRRRYIVECVTCRAVLHEATTGPAARIERHLQAEVDLSIPPSIPRVNFKVETFKAAGSHSPEIRERTCGYNGTVVPIRYYVDGDKLIQEFQYIDGPNKGETTRIITKRDDS